MHKDMLSHDHLAGLIARRDTIEAAMSQYLAGARQAHAGDEDKAAAHLLFDILLDGLHGVANRPSFEDPVIRRHASRFGDGLTPILKDALGADVPDDFVARCVDRFWVTLQAAAA